MILELTAEQLAAIQPELKPGRTLLGRVIPEGFEGGNPTTSGTLKLELGTVPTSALPALREAITKAGKPAKRATRKKNLNPSPTTTP